MATVLAGGVAGPVLAQESGNNVSSLADAGGRGAMLEEVVVTARKREESLQETPIAITVFSAQQIERPGIDDISDLARFSPNVIFDQGTGNTGGSNNAQVFIRGVGQTDFLFTTDPGVGLYVDDVYLPRVTGSILDLLDMERIEILRGPQGTLFGKNTIGGAINIISKKPTDEFGGDAELTVGSRDRLDAKASVNIPLIDGRLSSRLTASSRNQDGYVKRSLQSGVKTGDVNSDAFRGQLLWTPDDLWEIELAADYTRGREETVAGEMIDIDDSTSPMLQLWNAFVAPGYGPGVAYDRRYLAPEYHSNSTGPSFSDIDAWGGSLKVTRELTPDMQIKSVTAYRETDSYFGADQDHSPLTYAESTNDNRHDQFSQELQLSGSSIEGRFAWVVGGFYMHESASDVYDLTIAGGLFDALEQLPGPILPIAPGAICPPPAGTFQACAGGPGNPVNVDLDFEVTVFNDIDIDSYALYTQWTFDVTDRLSVTGGARFTREAKDLTTMLVRNASGVVSVPETDLEDQWEAFTPRVGVEYQWTPELMTYASAARGFKSGGFNGRATSVAEIDSFDPEYVWTYELGVKSEWFDRTLVANAAVFYSDYTDMQLTSLRQSGGLLVVVTENAGEAEMSGVELELMARPFEGLRLQAGLGYLDAKFTQLDPGATVTLDTQLVKTPEWTGSLSIDYEWSLGDAGFGTMAVGTNLSYRSDHFNEVANIELLEQEAYTLVGAHATYTSVNERWLMTLYGANLTDERYMTNGVGAADSAGTIDAVFGRPREWGASLQYLF